MTAKSINWKPNGQPEKMPGWFSWRHKTRKAHEEAVATHKSREDRRLEAEQRQANVRHERTKAHRLGHCACERAA
jgi:hypothetical protein